MNLFSHDIGVCSWSLGVSDPAQIIAHATRLGLSHVQIALLPLIALSQAERADYFGQYARAGISITAGALQFPGEDYSTIESIAATGGFRPDDRAAERIELAVNAGHIAAAAGIRIISMHGGFVPHPDDLAQRPAYKAFIRRLTDLATALQPVNVSVALETGQETPEVLLRVIADVAKPNLKANFDPANMILYGSGDPVNAIRVLGKYIAHVHVKDALASDQPGTTWGTEVPFGKGEVGPARFLTALKLSGYKGPLVIERHRGPDAMADIAAALDVIRNIPM